MILKAIFQPVYLREYCATTFAPYGINSGRKNIKDCIKSEYMQKNDFFMVIISQKMIYQYIELKNLYCT